ncbi:MAG: hypothetical protein WC474_02380 [Hydrogenophilaceae bacterium]
MKTKLKPRNPFVAAARFRQAGAHGKSVKALRREQAMRLQREIKNTDRPGYGPSARSRTTQAASVCVVRLH